MARIEVASVSARRRGVASVGRDSDRTVVWVAGGYRASVVAGRSEAMARAIAVADTDLVADRRCVRCRGASTAEPTAGLTNARGR